MAVCQLADPGHVCRRDHSPAASVVRVLHTDEPAVREVGVSGIADCSFKGAKVQRSVRLIGDGARVDATHNG